MINLVLIFGFITLIVATGRSTIASDLRKVWRMTADQLRTPELKRNRQVRSDDAIGLETGDKFPKLDHLMEHEVAELDNIDGRQLTHQSPASMISTTEEDASLLTSLGFTPSQGPLQIPRDPRIQAREGRKQAATQQQHIRDWQWPDSPPQTFSHHPGAQNPYHDTRPPAIRRQRTATAEPDVFEAFRNRVIADLLDLGEDPRLANDVILQAFVNVQNNLAARGETMTPNGVLSRMEKFNFKRFREVFEREQKRKKEGSHGAHVIGADQWDGL